MSDKARVFGKHFDFASSLMKGCIKVSTVWNLTLDVS